MVHEAIDFMHFLMQAPTERDIDLLEPATDREDRQAQFDRQRNQRQIGFIAGGIVEVARPAGFVAVVMRLDIAHRTGQQDAVQPFQQRSQRQRGLQTRDQQWQAPGTIDDGADVLLPGRKKRMRADEFAVGGQTDQR